VLFHTNINIEIGISAAIFILLVTVNSDTIKERLLFSILQTTGPVVKLLTELKSPLHSFFRLNSPEILCVSLNPYFDYTRLFDPLQFQ
jgi:hypothetical protein